MKIRAISADELHPFCRIGSSDEEAEALAQHLGEMWAIGSSAAETCFVAEDQGQFVGRMVYRKPGSGTRPSKTRIIDGGGWSLPWATAYCDLGVQLIQQSLKQLKAAGVGQVTGKVISRWPHGEKIGEVLRGAGLALEQEKRAFVWNEPRPLEARADRLVFKSLRDVGEKAFVAAIERSIEGSLDQVDQELSGEESHREIAVGHFDVDREYFGFEPEWWRLAQDRAGQTVGFVQPAYFKGEDKGDLKEGTIVYIGVVPQQRGNGYVVDLLHHATATLQQEGVWRILCDTDAQNFPMIRAFQSLDYEPYETVWMYTTSLA